MTASLLNNYSPSTAVLDNVMSAVDDETLGIISLSVTNYNSTMRPALCSGSIVEVSGNLFEFSTENTISTSGITSTAACDYYIKLVPSSSECSAQFSTVVPAWRTDYQGYYENSTSVNRVVGEMYFDGVDYIDKRLYYGRGVMKLQYVYGFLSTTLSGSTTISTYTIPMSGYIRSVTNVAMYGSFLLTGTMTGYTVNSTSVSVIYTPRGTSTYFGSILVSGVNY